MLPITAPSCLFRFLLQDRLVKNDVRYRFVIDIQGSLVA